MRLLRPDLVTVTFDRQLRSTDDFSGSGGKKLNRLYVGEVWTCTVAFIGSSITVGLELPFAEGFDIFEAFKLLDPASEAYIWSLLLHNGCLPAKIMNSPLEAEPVGDAARPTVGVTRPVCNGLFAPL